MKEDLIVVFNSTHQVLLGEKFLKQKRVRVEVIPLPKRFRADCGLALKINGVLKSLVEETFSAREVKYQGIYPLKE